MSEEIQPTYNLEAEMAMLGAALLSERALHEITRSGNADVFYRPAHRAIWQAMRELVERGMPCDMVTLEEQLKAKGNLENAGGGEYLLELATYVPSAANSDAYTAIVREKARRRKWRTHAMDLLRLVDSGADEQEILALHNSALSNVGMDIGGFETVEDVEITRPERGVPTGFAGVDRIVATGGAPGGQMCVFMAQEKAGKSAGMLQMMSHALQQDLPCVWISLADLNKARITARLIRGLCGFGNEDAAQKHGFLAEFREAEAIVKHRWDFRVMDATRSNADIETILGKLAVYHQRTPQALVFMDYAQKFWTRECRRSDAYSTLTICSQKVSQFCEANDLTIWVGSQETEGNEKLGTRTITKGGRALLEDCGLAIRVTREENTNASQFQIIASRFGGMWTKLSMVWCDEYLNFKPVAVPGAYTN